MAYPHKWSPISYKSSAGQRKHIGQRPMLYRWTTQPTYGHIAAALSVCVVLSRQNISKRKPCRAVTRLLA